MKLKIFLLVFLVTSAVHAGVCIKINAEKDTLMPNEQNAAKFICENEFKKEGAVVDGKCEETYILTHLLLGDSIVVVIEKAGVSQSVVVKGKDELRSAYNQLARYFISGIDPNYKNTTAENVVSTQAENRTKLKSELNFMAMLGYGFQPTPDIGGGLNWTLGLRYDMRFMFLDFEFASGLWNAHGPNYLEINLIGIRGAYYFEETGAQSAYIGAGLRAGFYFLESDDYYSDTEFSGSGTLSVGYEWLRNTSKRFMVQIDAKFPFHALKYETDDKWKHIYFPTISFNVGVGL